MITLIITLAIIGFIVWAITTYIPMPAIFKTVIYIITALVLIFYLMRVFGIADIPLR